jgi:undecaprenyl-diphosphatase
VQASGQSYPSAHAANSIGWLALAIALTVVIPTRARRTAAIAAGSLLAALVGLSRIYLRAHYASRRRRRRSTRCGNGVTARVADSQI